MFQINIIVIYNYESFLRYFLIKNLKYISLKIGKIIFQIVILNMPSETDQSPAVYLLKIYYCC